MVGGQLHDSKMIDCFLNWSKPPLAIVADKAYGSARILQEIQEEGALPVIPAKANAKTRSLTMLAYTPGATLLNAFSVA